MDAADKATHCSARPPSGSSWSWCSCPTANVAELSCHDSRRGNDFVWASSALHDTVVEFKLPGVRQYFVLASKR
eukprot:4952157-Amphidinium_carterae.2